MNTPVPNLDPEEQERLEARREYRNRHAGAYGIEAEAAEYVESLADDPDAVLSMRAIDLITRFVSYSSKNVDETSGQVHIATFNSADEQDSSVDRIGRNFLAGSAYVIHRDPHITETHSVESFLFQQFRRNGTAREVTIYRKEPLVTGQTLDQTVTYCLSFEDMAEYSETRLAKARYMFEILKPANLVDVALEATFNVKDQALKLGQQTLEAVLPSKPDSTEDSEV